MIVYHTNHTIILEKTLSNQYSSGSFFAKCWIFLWSEFPSSKSLKWKCFILSNWGFWLFLHHSFVLMLSLNLLFCSFIPLFSLILTVLIKENFMKHFQDLFKRKSRRINFFYMLVLKMPSFKTSQYCPREELWNSLLKYIESLGSKVAVFSFTPHIHIHTYLCIFSETQVSLFPGNFPQRTYKNA